MTPFPKVWVRLLIEDEQHLEELAKSFPEFSAFREQPELFQVAPGVLGRVQWTTLSPAMLEPHFSREPIPRHTVVLELSGGEPLANWTTTGRRSPDPAENELATQVAADLRVAMGQPDGHDEPHLGRVRAVIRVAHQATPFAAAIVIPEARVSYTPELFLKRTLEDVSHLNGIAGQTVVQTFGADRKARWFRTRGLLLYGLPDVGLCTIGSENQRDAMDLISELTADMMTWGYAPPHGESVTLGGRSFRVSRGVTLWLNPADAHPEWLEVSRLAHAHADFGVVAQRHLNASLLVQAYLDAPIEMPLHSIEVVVRDDGSYRLTTNGLSAAPRPGFEGEEGRLEIFLDAPVHGIALAHMLDLVASMVFGASSSSPVNHFDRLVLPEPIRALAGFVLAPRMDVTTGKNGEFLTWCEALPITLDELARLRAGTLTSRELSDSSETDAEFRRTIGARWRAVLDS